MADKIIIDYEAINKAISDLTKQQKKVDAVKSKIKTTPFYSNRKSKGPCAKRMENVSSRELVDVANNLSALISATSKFLNDAKEESKLMDNDMAKKY